MPIIPKDKDGNPYFEIDSEGNIVLPIDPVTGKPIVPRDDSGNYVLPVDRDGNLIPPKDQNNNPVKIIDKSGNQ